jgi:hypothetical protein
MSLDGKGIVMRREELREATRKATEWGQHKLKTRLSQGEKRNRKRMATVAAVYRIERDVRGAESIMGIKAEQDPSPKPRARNKRVWASVQRAPQAVTEEIFAEALAGPSDRFPSQVRFVGPSISHRWDTVSFPWEALRECPRVLVSLGTVNVLGGGRFFATVVEALGDQPFQG